MLRVGLTGGIGSGKSSAARMFAELGAHVFSADEIAREMMQPGHAVYAAIVERFGPGVVAPDGTLDRPALARIAFGDGRVEELNAIVHPATIARQAELIEQLAAREPDAVAMVESALIFQTKYGGEGGWQRRFDRIIVVKAPEDIRIARFVARVSGQKRPDEAVRTRLEAEARQRLARQGESEGNDGQIDFVLINDGPLDQLRMQVEALWPVLQQEARQPRG